MNRVAERLSASPSHWVHGSPPFHAINAALRAWIVEAEISVMGEPDPDADDPWAGHPHPMELPKDERARMRRAHQYARHVWEGWVLGGVTSDKLFGDPEKSIEAFARFGVPHSVAAGTAAALTRYLGERDRILRGAAPIIARWVAAEEVLVRVLAGEAVDSQRIAEAIEKRRHAWSETAAFGSMSHTTGDTRPGSGLAASSQGGLTVKPPSKMWPGCGTRLVEAEAELAHLGVEARFAGLLLKATLGRPMLD